MSENISFDRLLIATDLSPMDHCIFEFLVPFVQKVKPSFICVAHTMVERSVVYRRYTDPTEALAFYENLKSQLNESLQALIQEFDLGDAQVELRILEGKPYKEILHTIKNDRIDLLIVGKKELSTFSGLTAKKITRHMPCHILFVSENHSSACDKILVPYDYDNLSAQAIQLGIQLASNPVNTYGLHLMSILDHDHYYGIDLAPRYEETHAEEEAQANKDFLGKHNVDPDDLTILIKAERHNHFANRILREAADKQVDLILVGAIGHSTVHNLLIGSTSEHLVANLTSSTLLVIRNHDILS